MVVVTVHKSPPRPAPAAAAPAFAPLLDAWNYGIDAYQRSVLFLDTL